MGTHTNATPKAEPNDPNGVESVFAPSWFVPSPTITAAPSSTNWRSGVIAARLWSNLMGARLLVALGLMAIQVLAYTQGTARPWQMVLCALYLVATAAVLRWSRPARSDSFWSIGWGLTLWVDLTVFGVLQVFQTGVVNYTPLFVLPVLLASILGPLPLALGSAAFATLVLLFDTFTGEVLRPGQATANYVQSAITGVGLFLVALLANQLAARLGREQTQARLNRERAQAEAQINQLIVTGLNEGVVVLDGHGRIWHANPAACAMLLIPNASPPYTALLAQPGWAVLLEWAQTTMQLGQDDHCELSIPAVNGEPFHLLLRAKLTRSTSGHDTTACVLFMEDLRDVETRVRNEKLAAMGRVSVAIAHEIRNPLAAIAQANALLAEDTLMSPLQQRLSDMIGQNAKRLGRTVDDILDAARLPSGAEARIHHTPLDETVTTILREWHAQQTVETGFPAWKPDAPGVVVPMDPEHLRRVLVNLLDNALKYGTGGTAAIQVNTCTTSQLTVWNPGPPMPAQLAKHLFEPFASSHSRSSGLGLYLSRELCVHHGAQLGYQPSERQGVVGHEFKVTF